MTKNFFPTVCPSCGTPLVIERGDSVDTLKLMCKNDECEGSLLKKLQKGIMALEIKGLGPAIIEDLMNADLDSVHEAEHHLVATLNRTGDAFPGLGIVAAVLGVVITMGKLDQGKEVIGHSVGAALVGTLLGILIAYGYIQPLVAKIETK